MPVYQYACTDCSEELEVRQSFADDSLTTCPSCAGRLRKILSAVGVVFKGSGFYRNDSRPTPGSDSDTSSSEAKSETKGDAKESSSSSKPPESKESSSSGVTNQSSDKDSKQPSSSSRGSKKDRPSSDKGRLVG